MAQLTLTRTETSAEGTFGIITDEAGAEVAVTCERPEKDNQTKGCIPTGSYSVTPFKSPSKGLDFLVMGVPQRSMIEIHRGNTIRDTEGCILVGLERGEINDQAAVLQSASALGKMLDAYPSGFQLNIVEDYYA